MGVDIWDLAAKISVDAAPADRALTEHQKKVLKTVDDYNKLQAASKKVEQYLKDQSGATNKLSDAFKGLSAGATTLQGPMGGIASRIQSIGTLASSTGAAVGIFGVAILASAKASYELQQALFNLAVETAAWQGALTDLSQQTGVAVETLSAFEILARQTGGSLDSIVASLGIFQKNLEEATNPLSKAAVALDELGVNTLETEAALRQTMAALAKMPEGFHQTALALELFGRGGKQVLAILKETGGDLDAAQAKFRAMGLEVSGPTAAAADKLNDSMVILDAQVRALKGSLGVMVMPQVLSTVERLTALINDNKQAIGQLAFAVGVLASMFGDNLVTSLKVAAVGMAYLQSQLAPLVTLMQFVRGLKGQTGDIPAVGLPGKVEVGGSGGVGAGIFRPKVGGVGGGRGGGGGGGGAMDGGAALLQQLSKEFFRLTEHTKLEEIQEQLLEKQFEKTSDKIKKRIMIVATEIDIQKKTLALTRERFFSDEKLIRQKEQEYRIFQLLAKIKLLDLTRERFASPQGQARPSWIDLGGGSMVGGEPGTTGRGRIVTAERQGLQDKIIEFNARMQTLAAGLTSTIDRALTAGFQHGIAAGVRSFAEGILEMIRSAALAALEKKLTEIFTNILGGGKGGGILGAIFGIGSAVAGGAAGAGGTAVPFLGGVFGDGGFMQPNSWNIVGDKGPELVRAGNAGATVVPNGGGGSHTFVVNINVPNVQAAGSGATQHQIAKQLHGMMAKAVLTG